MIGRSGHFEANPKGLSFGDAKKTNPTIAAGRRQDSSVWAKGKRSKDGPPPPADCLLSMIDIFETRHISQRQQENLTAMPYGEYGALLIERQAEDIFDIAQVHASAQWASPQS